jgi:hypothetical protein
VRGPVRRHHACCYCAHIMTLFACIGSLAHPWVCSKHDVDAALHNVDASPVLLYQSQWSSQDSSTLTASLLLWCQLWEPAMPCLLVPSTAGATATWLFAIHCAGSSSKQQEAFSKPLKLDHPHPPQALLTTLLIGTQAPAAAAAAAGSSSQAEPPAAAGSAASRGQVQGRDAGVVNWLRAVTAAADWCCWALDQR